MGFGLHSPLIPSCTPPLTTFRDFIMTTTNSISSPDTTAETWLITGISSGFGRAIAEQLLAAGHRVVGTVRRIESVHDLLERHPDLLTVRTLDVRDREAVRALVDDTFAKHPVDVLVSNAGYGLFGAAEELSDADVDVVLATNLTGSIDLIRFSLPHFRKQGFGRIVQISSYGGQVAFAGNSLYHATKWGIEGFCESVAADMKPFGIGVTIIEPGGARTDFRYRSARVADPIPAYDGTPAHAFQAMLNPENGLAAGDPEKMAARIIEAARRSDVPLRVVLGSQALACTIDTLEKRLADFRTQTDVARSTDFE